MIPWWFSKKPLALLMLGKSRGLSVLMQIICSRVFIYALSYTAIKATVYGINNWLSVYLKDHKLGDVISFILCKHKL